VALRQHDYVPARELPSQRIGGMLNYERRRIHEEECEIKGSNQTIAAGQVRLRQLCMHSESRYGRTPGKFGVLWRGMRRQSVHHRRMSLRARRLRDVN
jgi:hypothetical protein